MGYFTRFRGLATVVGVLVVSACSKKSDPAILPPTQGMTWVVDGIAVKTNNFRATPLSPPGVVTSQFAEISATVRLADYNHLRIVLPYPFTVGTYPVRRSTSYQPGGASVFYTETGIPGNGGYLYGTSGTVTVTKIVNDFTAVGTFAFATQCDCAAGRTHNFTEGTFAAR